MADPGDVTVTFNANGTFHLDQPFEYVDATTFGDTNRTYLVGMRNVAGTFEGAMDPLVTLRNVAAKMKNHKRTKEQAALHREAVFNLYNKVTNLWQDFSEEMAAAGIAATSTSDLINQISVEMHAIERYEAEEKAEWLLDQHLTDAQRKTFAKKGYIEVIGKGANTYRINKSATTSVWTKPEGRWRKFGEFCMYPSDHTLPIADKILATKMYLEADEEGYLKVANFSSTQGAFRKLSIDGTIATRNYTRFAYNWVLPDALLDADDFRVALTNNAYNTLTTTTNTTANEELTRRGENS